VKNRTACEKDKIRQTVEEEGKNGVTVVGIISYPVDVMASTKEERK
jgi:hypothetical protein